MPLGFFRAVSTPTLEYKYQKAKYSHFYSHNVKAEKNAEHPLGEIDHVREGVPLCVMGSTPLMV